MSDSPVDVNKVTERDVAYTTVKAIVDSIPFVGAAASDLLGLIITPPLEKRKKEWMQDIGERLKELEEDEHLDLKTLSTNEQFIDIVLQATTLAMRTSQQEKLIAFKNIIANTAKGISPDETKCQIFMSFVDSFTPWHLKILHLVDNPRKWYQMNSRNPPEVMLGSSLLSLLNDAFPELRSEDELVGLIWEDLKRAGLHNSGSGSLRTMMTGDGVLSARTTALGKEFISFISNH